MHHKASCLGVTIDVKLTHPSDLKLTHLRHHFRLFARKGRVSMLTQEQVVQIHGLRRQGKSLREIAREPRVSRNIVPRYLWDLSARPV
jgi:hypothetical protein